MVAKTFSACAVSIDSIPVEVQIDCKVGLPIFNIIGHAGRSVQESKDRIVPAIRNSGYEFKPQRIVVNLLPSHLAKNDSHYDLAIAVGYLQATKQIKVVEKVCYIGELGLDGSILPVKSINILLSTLNKTEFDAVYIPYENQKDIVFDYGLNLFGVKNISEAILGKGEKILVKRKLQSFPTPHRYLWDEVQGNIEEKKAIIVALAGGHHTLLYGCPGSGKTMLATAVLELLPQLETADAQVVSLIYERAQQPRLEPYSTPVRRPHHASSIVGILGGGANILPGEVSLAHKGVLFLDELSEFDTKVIEALRIPLAEGKIILAKAHNSTTLPAEIQLVATTNPCACGFLGHPNEICICTDKAKSLYWKGLSTAIFDRIEMFIPMFHVKHSDEKSHDAKYVEKVIAQCRYMQIARQGKLNSKLSLAEMQSSLWFGPAWDWVSLAFGSTKVSTRRKLAILKLARTIADLENKDSIETTHLSQAVSYSEGGKWS